MPAVGVNQMSAAAAAKRRRTRTDYRTAPEGSITHYLLHLYPMRQDYVPEIKRSYSQLVDTTTDGSGHYSHIDRRGFLQMSRQFENDMNRIPWSQWQVAIAEIRNMPEGAMMVKALEWYQQHRILKAKGVSREDYAAEMGISQTTLRKLMRDCVLLIKQIVASA